ncbi:hypothetical protein AB205_0190930, partial [Aquarana catesbeiana]
MGDDLYKKKEFPPEISTDTRETQRDIKVEKEEEGHVRIKEEEDLMEISTGASNDQNPPERCPGPHNSRDSKEENDEIPQDDQ